MIFKNLFHVKPFIPLTSFGVELRIFFYSFFHYIFVYVFVFDWVRLNEIIISISDKDMEFSTLNVFSLMALNRINFMVPNKKRK